jgi:uncharacterized protein
VSQLAAAARAVASDSRPKKSLKCAHRLIWAPSSYFCLLVLLLAIAGCKKQVGALPPAKLHGVTRQFAAAAKAAVPANSQVRMEFRDSDGTDHLQIKIASPTFSPNPRGDAFRVLQALNSVAVANSLTQDAASEAPSALSMVFRYGGVPTHKVQIDFLSPAELRSSGTPPPPSAHGPAKLAILLDDLGSDSPVAQEIFALPYPLTISVLPQHPHSIEIAEEARHRGFEVMLHLPMQSVGKEQPEKQQLRPGMPESQVSAMLEQFLADVPGAQGVNNHQGSRATADPALMSELMRVLHTHHVFYVDSRTTAATAAYDTARQEGVPAAFRNVPFLDDVENVPAIENQLALAIRGAREKGEAIAIGHPHPATLQALRAMLPKAQPEGVQLVFVSDLVH